MPTARTKSGGAIVGDYFAVVSFLRILVDIKALFASRLKAEEKNRRSW